MTLANLKQITKPPRKGPSFLESKLDITELTPEEKAQHNYEIAKILEDACDEMRASHEVDYGGIT